MNKSQSCLLITIFLFSSFARLIAAPDITHPVQTICKGGSATLSTTTIGDKYEWSPSTGLSATDKQSVTAKPTQATTYTCKVTQKGGSYDTGNLISIGGFEFPPSCLNYDSGNKCSKAQNKMGDMITYDYPNFQKTGQIYDYGQSTTVENTSSLTMRKFYSLKPHGGDYFLVCDGGSNKDAVIWSASGIRLQKGVTYQFSCWAANVFANQVVGDTKTCSNIKFMIKKGSGSTETLATITTSSTPGVWNEYKNAKFTADNDYSNCTVYIVNDNVSPQGNDFALDDVYFGTEIKTEDEVTKEIFEVKVDVPATATIADQTVCSSAPVTVAANISGAYDKISWTKNGNPISETSTSVSGTAPSTVGASDTYEISVTTGVCQANKATGTVTAMNCGSDISWETYKCYNTAYDLKAKTSGGAKYEWKTADGTLLPSTTQTLSISNVKPAKYVCVVTQSNGSTVTEKIELKVYPQYTLSFGDESGNPFEACSGESGLRLYVGFDIDPNPCEHTQGCDESGATYTVQWTKNGVPQDPTQFIRSGSQPFIKDITAPAKPGQTDNYTFTYTNDKDNSCSWSASSSITAKDCSNPPILHSPTACQGETVTLTTDTEGKTYSWSDGTKVVGTERSLILTDVNPEDSKKYTCTVTKSDVIISENIIPNGDMEDISTSCPYQGFTSEYYCFGYNVPFDFSLPYRGFYRLSSTSTQRHLTPHSGSSMLEYDGASVTPGKILWKSSISGAFKMGEEVKFSFWGVSDLTDNPANISFYVKYNSIDKELFNATLTDDWTEYSAPHIVSEDCSVIEFYLIDNTLIEWGNDFLIDDIFMQKITRLTKPEIQDEIFALTVNPKLTENISDNVHKGKSYNKNGFNIPASEIVTTGQITKSITTPSKLTQCDSTTILTLNVYDTKEVVECYGSEQTFESMTTGVSYKWNVAGKTGSDARQITINTDAIDLVCTVSFADGTSTNDTIFLKAYVHPGSETHFSQEDCAGATASITIEPQPTPQGYESKPAKYFWSPKFQWSLNGTEIPGEETQTLSDAKYPLVVGDANVYSIVTTNGTCSVTSTATLKAKKCEPAPIEHTESVCQTEGGTHTLQTTTEGDSYLWSDGSTTRSTTIDISKAGVINMSCTVTIGDGVATPEIHQVENFNVTVNPIQYNTINDKVCQGDSYQKYGFDIQPSETAVTGVIERRLTTQTVKTKCDSVVTLKLTVYPVKKSEPQGETCQGESYSKDGFTFTSSETSKIGTISKTRVEKTKECGCDSTVTFYLTINENPQFKVDVNGRSAVITTSKGVAPFTYLIDNKTTYQTETITGLSVGKHTILVTDSKTCKSSGDFEVVPVPIEPMVYFSPNSDGMNDLWLIKGIDYYPTAIIQIFDRFGKLLLSCQASDFSGWNGVYNGHPMPMTDYWYIITSDELGKSISGHFILKR